MLTARVLTTLYMCPPDVVTLKSQCCITTHDGNGELKPVTTGTISSSDRITHPNCWCAMSVQRLSLIYLVKELSGCQNQNKAHTVRFVLSPIDAIW